MYITLRYYIYKMLKYSLYVQENYFYAMFLSRNVKRDFESFFPYGIFLFADTSFFEKDLDKNIDVISRESA